MSIHSECRSSSASSSTWTTTSLSNRTHCLNLFRLRIPQIVPVVVVVVVVNVVGIVDDDAPRPLAGDCTSTSWCALVLCETCCSIFIPTSSRSVHSCKSCICVVGHSLDMSTD